MGDRYLVSLFRLVGIEAVEADDEDSAASKVEELVERGECRVLFVSEKVAARLKVLRESLIRKRKLYPVFVVIPDFEGSLGDRKRELTQVVNKSVGMKLKLGE